MEIDELKQELKELRQYKKDCERYFSYEYKLLCLKKLTAKQQLWYDNFEFNNIIIKGTEKLLKKDKYWR